MELFLDRALSDLGGGREVEMSRLLVFILWLPHLVCVETLLDMVRSERVLDMYILQEVSCIHDNSCSMYMPIHQ